MGGLSRDLNGHDIRFDPSDSRPVYIGVNEEFGVATAKTTWQIYEFTYTTSTSSAITRIRRTRGAWDDRATLFP